MNYYAHTTKNQDKLDWELLTAHLIETSDLSEKFVSKFTSEHAIEAKIMGKLHDLGKYADKMQARFENNNITGINHWTSGAYEAFNRGYPFAAFCIQGHHVGLPNASELASILKKLKYNEHYIKVMGFDESHDSIINKFINDGMTLPTVCLHGRGYDFSTSILIRMLFSCLIDADRTLTSRFYNNIINPLDVEYPELNPDKALNLLLDAIKLKSNNTTVGNLRNKVLNDCLESAKLPPGIFTLTVPTGGAKTLSSLAFALKHASIYKKEKIISVIPFTSIIDQTASVYSDDVKFKQYFGDDYILEHHSKLEVDFSEVENYKVGTSTWKNPIVVTTSNQFIESLFSNNPSACQKLHNIPNSVIIFDEVQTFPVKLLKSILSSLQVLVKEYNCSIVFCSATVPAFESVKLNDQWNPIEISSNPELLASTLKRVNIKLKKRPISHLQLAKRISTHKQCLTVVNSKHDALLVFNELNKLNIDGCYHLSTNMCAMHRREILSKIYERLYNKLPCKLISTQLLEAGVDIDFPYGFRVYAPLCSIIQTGGRINREGKMKVNGTLEVIKLLDSRNPRGDYPAKIAITDSFINQSKNIDFHSPDVYKRYYKQMYSLIGKQTDNVFIASSNLQFETVAEECKLINDITVSVIVPYGTGIGFIDQIKKTSEVPKWMYRKLQVVSVNIYKNKIDQMLWDGVLGEIVCGDSKVYYWKGNYSNITGLEYTPSTPANFIV